MSLVSRVVGWIGGVTVAPIIMGLAAFIFLFSQIVFYSSGAVRHISDDELKKFVGSLLENDKNSAAAYVKLNLQSRSPYDSTQDLAPEVLLNVDKQVYQIPTVLLLSKFYDNYIPDVTKNEVVTPEEKKEEEAFMNAVLNTTVMSMTQSFLSSKGDRKRGSSAFEHVFLGEFKKGQVSGLHNWLFFSHEEKTRQLNYYGWSKKLEFPKKKGGVLKVKYAWNGLLKPAGSMFIGTSPEFEVALYTVCFLARPNDRCNVAVGEKTFHVQTYAFTYDGNTLISSAYPNL